MDMVTITAMHDPDLAELRLLQLASPTLPVGAYTHSEGLESAVDLGWVDDEASAERWILGLLDASLKLLDVPVLARVHDAWQAGDRDRARRWSARLLAARGTHELRESDRRMGRALARLLATLEVEGADEWTHARHATFAAAFAIGSAAWGVPVGRAARGFLWAWCENQVAAAIKLVPLGQSAGQRVLLRAGEAIPEAALAGLALADDAIGSFAPGAAIASALHETQYSRLFRS